LATTVAIPAKALGSEQAMLRNPELCQAIEEMGRAALAESQDPGPIRRAALAAVTEQWPRTPTKRIAIPLRTG
jgi:hypothetical protein